MEISISKPTFTAWDKRSSQGVEEIYPGSSRMWMAQGRIVCYTVTTIERRAIDAWAAATLDLIKVWPIDIPTFPSMISPKLH